MLYPVLSSLHLNAVGEMERNFLFVQCIVSHPIICLYFPAVLYEVATFFCCLDQNVCIFFL